MAIEARYGEPRQMATRKKSVAIPIKHITKSIVILREQRILLDTQLAELYGITTKVLNQAVKRNIDRFPRDFLFRLIKAESAELNRSQIVTGPQKHRDPRYPPNAFTEHGAIMAARCSIAQALLK
ncbi:MAG: ORF6N domain-containing protein [Steroidobacteraceae bacterium]